MVRGCDTLTNYMYGQHSSNNELKETELCTFCTETKESLFHLFWDCTYSKKKWFSLVNVLENCGLKYINAPNIILGIANPLDPNITINQTILILKYYLV
jgi:hypothetical protein